MSNVRKYLVAGHAPVLKAISTPVLPGERLGLDILKLVCRKHRDPSAAGLAAPQIGLGRRVIVTNVRGEHGPIVLRVMINPEIVARSNETDVRVEGCLSYPGREKAIRRHIQITVKWEDEKRRPRLDLFKGFEARVIQHEVDHLNGICRVGDESPADMEAALKSLMSNACC